MFSLRVRPIVAVFTAGTADRTNPTLSPATRHPPRSTESLFCAGNYGDPYQEDGAVLAQAWTGTSARVNLPS